MFVFCAFVHSTDGPEVLYFWVVVDLLSGSVAEWLACWTQAQKGPGSIAAVTLSGNSLRQTVHAYRASVYQAAKLVAALLRVAGVTAGLAESIGSLPSGLWPAGWLPRTGISSRTLCLVIEYGLPFLPLKAVPTFLSFHFDLCGKLSVFAWWTDNCFCLTCLLDYLLVVQV